MQANKTLLSTMLGTILGLSALASYAADPVVWTTKIDPLTYGGSYGTIKFNDWGYKGPRGVGANDFQVGPGFDNAPYRLGQIQHVESVAPDWKTPDAPYTTWGDNLVTLSSINGSLELNVGSYSIVQSFSLPGLTTYPNASMDGQTNFFRFGYTSPAGQKFLNMKIDKAGNYHIAKADMQWKLYGQFLYHDVTGSNPDKTVNTTISFLPYPVSDAKGWCGSTLISNPNTVDKMAGQVTFDFALAASVAGAGPTTQIVPGFIMRSYGDYDINVTTPTGVNQHFTGSAVMNNTNPLTHVPGFGGQLDANYRNKVSFLGGGVVPAGAWVVNDNTPDVHVVPYGTPGATWHANTFAGYAFLLRADAKRTLDWINPTGHSDYVDTDPAAYVGLTQ